MFSRFRKPRPVDGPDALSGYEASILLDVVLAKTKALTPVTVATLMGGERTMLSVLLAEKMTKSAPLRVLDFGGACGFHHMAAIQVGVPLRWAVVESPSMAEKASVLASEACRFFVGIDDAMNWLGGIDLMFSSSALQYVDDPDATLRQLVGLDAPLMVWSRLPLSSGPTRRDVQTSRLADNGPGPLPPGFKDREVICPVTYMSESAFMAAHSRYRPVIRSGDVTSTGLTFLRNDLNL